MQEYTPFVEGETKTVYTPKDPKAKKRKATHSYHRAFDRGVYGIQEQSVEAEGRTRLYPFKEIRGIYQ